MRTLPLLTSLLLFACASAPDTPTPSKIEGVRGVDHIGLTVTNLEASRAFFVEALGFRVRGKDDKYPAYFLTNGATTITLWRAKDLTTARPFDRAQNVGLHHLALAVSSFEELDRLAATLRSYPGVTIEFMPELSYGGPAKHMMIREPSGNRLEFIHRP